MEMCIGFQEKAGEVFQGFKGVLRIVNAQEESFDHNKTSLLIISSFLYFLAKQMAKS
jgi:hypothetical protein